jgi:hypothetical protein
MHNSPPASPAKAVSYKHHPFFHFHYQRLTKKEELFCRFWYVVQIFFIPLIQAVFGLHEAQFMQFCEHRREEMVRQIIAGIKYS